jgi:hypothetical protein
VNEIERRRNSFMVNFDGEIFCPSNGFFKVKILRNGLTQEARSKMVGLKVIYIFIFHCYLNF